MKIDITKCSGDNCPLKENCWRYLAKPSEYQSWVAPEFKDGDCVNLFEVSVHHKD